MSTRLIERGYAYKSRMSPQRDRARAQIRLLSDSGALEKLSPARLWSLFNMAEIPSIAGGAGAVSPVGLPPAAGGVDVATGLTSIIPGIRKLKKITNTAPIPINGGIVKLDLPKSSYVQKMVIRISGTLRITQPAAAVTITATDPRTFVSSIEFALSGTTSPRKLTGIQHDVIDNLDVPAIAPNAQTYSAGPAGANSSVTDTPFALEFSPTLTVSDQNLYGIPYLGGQSTVPQLILTFADPNGSLATPGGALGVGSIILFAGQVELEMWRVDLPGPVAPQVYQQTVNGQTQDVTIPGQGLYMESSYILLSRMFDSQDVNGASSIKKFRLPIGPDYLRIILFAIQNNALDLETSPMLDHADLTVQQATGIESKKIWEFDNEYRRTYNKNRPKGVYVFSGIDLTGTDADLYVSRDLGNFDVDVYGSGNVPAANSRYQIVTQQLVPLSQPGEYL